MELEYIPIFITHYAYNACFITVILGVIVEGFPGGSNGKESACNAGDPGLILGLRRSPGEGNGYPLQYSCLENSVDRGAWQATALGVVKSQMQMSDQCTHTVQG